MTTITDSLTIRGHTIRNRLAMLPVYTFSFCGEEHAFYGKQHRAHYAEIIQGGVGLLILQATHMAGAEEGIGQWTPGSLATLRAIAEDARAGHCTAAMQLSFGGDRTVDAGAFPPEALRGCQKEMRAAALRAREAGFCGVEYHFAHGFFLSKFLDAAENRRTDAYGGDATGRTRLLTEALPGIRAAVGEDFIIGVRMGAYLPTLEEGRDVARIFEQAGVDLLSISFGAHMPKGPVPDDFPFSPVTWSGALIKQAVGIPVIGAYGLNSAEAVRLLIEKGWADLAGVARAVLADPAFPERVIRNEPVNPCLQCKQCFWFTDHAACPARMIAAKGTSRGTPHPRS